MSEKSVTTATALGEPCGPVAVATDRRGGGYVNADQRSVSPNPVLFVEIQEKSQRKADGWMPRLVEFGAG